MTILPIFFCYAGGLSFKKRISYCGKSYFGGHYSVHLFNFIIMKARSFQFVSFLGFALWLISMPLRGQEKEIVNDYSKRPLVSSIEIFVGPSHSYFRWDFPYSQNLNLSLSGGIGITHIFRERLEIDAKIMIEEKGFQTEYVETLFDANNNAITSCYFQSGQLRYATLILMPRIILDKSNHFFLGLGSYFSLLNRASETVERFSLDGSQFSVSNSETTQNYQPFDFGISTTVGYRTPLSKRFGITSQLLLNWGLTNISDVPLSASKIKNTSVSLLIGLTIK